MFRQKFFKILDDVILHLYNDILYLSYFYFNQIINDVINPYTRDIFVSAAILCTESLAIPI